MRPAADVVHLADRIEHFGYVTTRKAGDTIARLFRR